MLVRVTLALATLFALALPASAASPRDEALRELGAWRQTLASAR